MEEERERGERKVEEVEKFWQDEVKAERERGDAREARAAAEWKALYKEEKAFRQALLHRRALAFERGDRGQWIVHDRTVREN